MAVSKSLYEKLGGVNPDTLTCESEDDVILMEPTRKKPRMEGIPASKSILEDIYKQVTNLEEIKQKVTYIGQISHLSIVLKRLYNA